MREGQNIALKAALALVLMAGASACERKETGPELSAEPTAPVAATPVPAATQDPDAIRPLFTLAGGDENGDGKLSSAEYATASAKLFQSIDADGDGSIGLGELDAARSALRMTDETSSEKLIAASDNDRDGKLTLAEFVASSNARFQRADANQDGFLDQSEWMKTHPPDASDAPPNTVEMMKAGAADKN